MDGKTSIKVDFDYMNFLVDENKQYITNFQDSCLNSVPVIARTVMAIIATCPAGTMEILFHPEIHGETFECISLQSKGALNYFRLYETETKNLFNIIEQGVLDQIEAPIDVVKVFYEQQPDRDGEMAWVLKEEIRRETTNIINQGFPAYIQKNGYTEDKSRFADDFYARKKGRSGGEYKD